MAFVSHKHKFVLLHIQKTGGSSLKKVMKEMGAVELMQHATIKEVQDRGYYCPDYTWIVFVRNPWDRLVSWYCFLKQTDPNRDKLVKMPFGDFMTWLGRKPRQVDFLKTDYYVKKIVIGRFENYESDAKRIFANFGLFFDVPHENKSEHVAYQHYYTEDVLMSPNYLWYTEADSKSFGYEING